MKAIQFQSPTDLNRARGRFQFYGWIVAVAHLTLFVTYYDQQGARDFREWLGKVGISVEKD